MEEGAALKSHHLSGFVCLFLVSSFEDFEGVVYTTAVVDSAKTWVCHFRMLEAQACLLSVWGRCFREVLVFSLRGVLVVEALVWIQRGVAEGVAEAGILEAGPGALASACWENYSGYSKTKAPHHFQVTPM